MSPAGYVDPEDLAGISQQDRHTIALWLSQRAETMRASWLGTTFAQIGSEALLGAAVDLFDPLSEDSTIMHSIEVLSAMGAKVPIGPTAPPEPR